MEIIITAVISVLFASRLLRACRDLADEAESLCPTMAAIVHKAVLEPVDSFLEAQGYLPRAKCTEAIQQAFIAVQERDAEAARANRLVDRVAQAALTVISLEGELAEARRTSGADPLFAAVGLHSQAEPFVITAAQRAYRLRHHPDMKASEDKLAAQREFQQYENIFDQIRSVRGLR